ncbi:acyl carrier protein [Vibrio sp. Of7-15]|uniref:acyl carrier protein n=1 Tax=Vibrio sp. Of7-15 TaxID=2724879 RepID=UPI001EF334BA|nr:acyl carrier protein [Vibrio sp. Of7-15]MCG7499641.1 acyl carrier protein [Vibrio sp. Of7-15]
MNILDRLSDIIQDVLDDDELEITRNTTADDAEDWDSLAQIQIIDALEKEFHIKLSMAEIEQMNQAGHVGATVDLIAQKLTA